MITLKTLNDFYGDAVYTTFVVEGNTFPIRDKIKAAGFHWGYPFYLHMMNAPEGQPLDSESVRILYGPINKRWSVTLRNLTGEEIRSKEAEYKQELGIE